MQARFKMVELTFIKPWWYEQIKTGHVSLQWKHNFLLYSRNIRFLYLRNRSFKCRYLRSLIVSKHHFQTITNVQRINVRYIDIWYYFVRDNTGTSKRWKEISKSDCNLLMVVDFWIRHNVVRFKYTFLDSKNNQNVLASPFHLKITFKVTSFRSFARLVCKP